MRCFKSLLFVALIVAVGCSGPGVLDDEEPIAPTPIVVNDTTNDDDDDTAHIEPISAYSIAEAQAKYAEDVKLPVVVSGYIVGTVKGPIASGCNFAAPFTVETNLLLADTPDTYDPSACLPVELKKGSTIRSKLNLVDNPGRLGIKVVIAGVLQRYFRVAGLKSVSDFVIIEQTNIIGDE